MCNDRGYDVDDADLELSLDGWIERFGDAPKDNNPGRKNLNFLVYHDKDAMNRMFVLFAEQHTVTGDDLKAYMAKMKDGSVERAIIVYENKITPMARNQMDEMRNMADGIEGRKYVKLHPDPRTHQRPPNLLYYMGRMHPFAFDNVGLKESCRKQVFLCGHPTSVLL